VIGGTGQTDEQADERVDGLSNEAVRSAMSSAGVCGEGDHTPVTPTLAVPGPRSEQA
jgi:hypothetical protein